MFSIWISLHLLNIVESFSLEAREDGYQQSLITSIAKVTLTYSINPKRNRFATFKSCFCSLKPELSATQWGLISLNYGLLLPHNETRSPNFSPTRAYLNYRSGFPKEQMACVYTYTNGEKNNGIFPPTIQTNPVL